MRVNLFRSLLALGVLITCAASPALAQSVLRGKALDNQGKPVPDAVVLFERQDMNQKAQGKTDRNGEFIQVGLASGEWKVTISKDGVGTTSMTVGVKQGNNPVMTLNLVPAAAAGGGGGLVSKDKEEAAALQALAAGALAAFKAGDNDTAIARFNDVIVKAPTCADCYYNLALAHTNKKEYDKAEAAYKKMIELKPDSAEAYTGLANIYNTQRKFDLAAEASANASKYATGALGAAGGSAESFYNQGVILFNSQKFPEAKAQFESAVKADPNMAMAQYQLGMTALNLGDFALAVTSLETYLKLEPNGAKAGEVKASLPALQSMVKK